MGESRDPVRQPAGRGRKERLLLLLMLALLAVVVEAASYLAVTRLEAATRNARIAGIIWPGSHHSAEEVEAAFSDRDDLLGWPMAELLDSQRYDSRGARPSPAFPETATPCVATFGDSFTYAQEASHEDAWGNRLAERLGCPVANYGVPGYGVDQAYLRYQRKLDAIAPVSAVVIGFFPENIMRHVNQYVGFRVARGNLLFKPRFVLENGELTLHPPLSRARFDEDALNQRPAELLPYEFFLPGSDYGPVEPRFPYTFTALRALLHPRVVATIRGRPSWFDLYQDGSAGSGGLALTERLLEAFARDVESSDKVALVFVFSNANSVEAYQRTGLWPYQAVLDFMAEARIPYVHAGPQLDSTYGEDVCRAFTRENIFGCTGHYTPEAYAMVAEMIEQRLRARGPFPPRS